MSMAGAGVGAGAGAGDGAGDGAGATAKFGMRTLSTMWTTPLEAMLSAAVTVAGSPPPASGVMVTESPTLAVREWPVNSVSKFIPSVKSLDVASCPTTWYSNTSFVWSAVNESRVL